MLSIREQLHLYETVLHEIGHALGLSNAAPVHDYYFPNALSPEEQYIVSHPTIPDSVLNYSKYTKVEPDCSPHPLDVMVVFALYQNVP